MNPQELMQMIAHGARQQHQPMRQQGGMGQRLERPGRARQAADPAEALVRKLLPPKMSDAMKNC